jgi:hypothetical protein
LLLSGEGNATELLGNVAKASKMLKMPNNFRYDLKRKKILEMGCGNCRVRKGHEHWQCQFVDNVCSVVGLLYQGRRALWMLPPFKYWTVASFIDDYTSWEFDIEIIMALMRPVTRWKDLTRSAVFVHGEALCLLHIA